MHTHIIGQTGSGKTFSMMGTDNISPAQDKPANINTNNNNAGEKFKAIEGILVLSLKDLFDQMKKVIQRIAF